MKGNIVTVSKNEDADVFGRVIILLTTWYEVIHSPTQWVTPMTLCQVLRWTALRMQLLSGLCMG